MAGATQYIAVGKVPWRTDGVISLHVGDTFILLMPDEARNLATELLSKSAAPDRTATQVSE